MASSNARQRMLARAKVDRQLARRADRTRRSRQLKAAVGGLLAVAVVALGTTWLLGGFDKEPVTTVADSCVYNRQDTTANTNLKAVDPPAGNGMPQTGTAAMTIALDSGNVVASLDRTLAPCAAASLTHLAGKGFFNNTKCHELIHDDGLYALRCGDDSGTGQGGAAYTWFPENVPNEALTPEATPSASASSAAKPSPSPSKAAAPVRYHRGDIAMTPGLNGSQFLIFYKDSTAETANFSIVGTVSSGIEVVEKIAKAGTVPNAAEQDTKPKTDVTIKTLTVVDATATNPSAAGTTPKPSASAAGTTPKPSASAAAAS